MTKYELRHTREGQARRRVVPSFAACSSLFIVLLCGASAARAVTPATLIDAEVRRVPIRFVSLADGRMTFFDAERKLTTEAVDAYVGVRFDAGDEAGPGANGAAPAAPPARPTLRLNDGHVLTGQFAGVDDNGRLLWQSAAMGNLPIKLDDVASFTVDPAVGPAPAGPTPAHDTIELTNGDRLTGFIASIDAKGITLTVNDKPLLLAWDRLRRVALANPVVRKSGTWVTLADGSHLRVEAPSMDSDRLKATALGDRPIDITLAQVRGIDFAARRRLVPIADFAMTITDGGVVFGVPTPPRIEGDTAHLHAPIAAKFELPEGAVRFAALASLDPADLDWAHLVLIVADGKGELARHTLSPASPTVEVNVALRDRSLTLTLDPAVNGPVRDRLTLSHAAVLVEADQPK